MRRVVLAAVCGLALGGAGCGELPDVTTVKDLRVLAVKCEPAGFLVDLDNPGAAMQSDLTAKITALVADPLAPGGMVTVSAVGCPDYIDTITSATGQGTKLCPPASATANIPEPLRTALTTTTIIPPDMPQSFPATSANPIEYNPQISFGLRPDQIGAFFSPTATGIAELDQSIAYNRDFGLPGIVNLDFNLNAEHAVAIKNVVYWPRLDPSQQPNQNPTLTDVYLYRHVDPSTGALDQQITDGNYTFSISAGDKLYVQPDYAAAVETNYLLRVKNVDTNQVETKIIERELVRMNFYATAGTLSPEDTQSEQDPALTGAFYTYSEYHLPKVEDRPADGLVTIWVVTHDERAGSDWRSVVITVLP